MRSFISRFQYRTIVCLVLMCTLMLLCIVRIISICHDSRLTSNTANTVTVELESSRGDIFDCNGARITSAVERYAIVFLPCDQAMIRFSQETTDEEREAGLVRLRQKKPTVLMREKRISGIGIYSFAVQDRYADLGDLEHLIGYIDTEKHGVSGLEKVYDTLLFTDSDAQVSFAQDARGNFLLGQDPVVNQPAQDNALYLTIDRQIQQICAEAAADISKGAVVVSEIKSGKIRAMISRPGFSVDQLADYIEREDSPFLNRALSAYSVGSVFKPLIAAGMLESGQGSFTHQCTGYSEFLGLRFYCNDHSGHGLMDLKSALTLSCNTYFYNGAATVLPSTLSDLATSFGFGNPVQLCSGISADAGTVTTTEQLERSSAAIANFAIGQGNIALSPLVLCNLYSAIANDGVYFAPTLVEGIRENGKYTPQAQGDKNVVVSKGTAAVLKEYLIHVVESGTGTSAKPMSGGAGGKTATAQTGRYAQNKELLNAWFCGFFPAEDPKYTVVVMAEDATSGSGDCGPVFKQIAEGIAQLK